MNRERYEAFRDYVAMKNDIQKLQFQVLTGVKPGKPSEKATEEFFDLCAKKHKNSIDAEMSVDEFDKWANIDLSWIYVGDTIINPYGRLRVVR